MLIFAAEKSRLLWKLCQEIVELCYHLISTYFEDKETHLYDHIYVYIYSVYIYIRMFHPTKGASQSGNLSASISMCLETTLMFVWHK